MSDRNPYAEYHSRHRQQVHHSNSQTFHNSEENLNEAAMRDSQLQYYSGEAHPYGAILPHGTFQDTSTTAYRMYTGEETYVNEWDPTPGYPQSNLRPFKDIHGSRNNSFSEYEPSTVDPQDLSGNRRGPTSPHSLAGLRITSCNDEMERLMVYHQSQLSGRSYFPEPTPHNPNALVSRRMVSARDVRPSYRADDTHNLLSLERSALVNGPQDRQNRNNNLYNLQSLVPVIDTSVSRYSHQSFDGSSGYTIQHYAGHESGSDTYSSPSPLSSPPMTSSSSGFSPLYDVGYPKPVEMRRVPDGIMRNIEELWRQDASGTECLICEGKLMEFRRTNGRIQWSKRHMQECHSQKLAQMLKDSPSFELDDPDMDSLFMCLLALWVRKSKKLPHPNPHIRAEAAAFIEEMKQASEQRRETAYFNGLRGCAHLFCEFLLKGDVHCTVCGKDYTRNTSKKRHQCSFTTP